LSDSTFGGGVWGFEVLGQPYPDLPKSYRGTARNTPLIDARLGMDHDAKRAILAEAVDGRITSIESARRLQRAQHDRDEAFEIVEVVPRGAQPTEGESLLGYDVAFEGGIESLVAQLLLAGVERGQQQSAMDVAIASLQAQFVHRLNDHGLFADEREATAFLQKALEFGPWEGPGVTWGGSRRLAR
jgi:hypothetical protein